MNLKNEKLEHSNTIFTGHINNTKQTLLRNVKTIATDEVYKEDKNDLTIQYKIPKNTRSIMIFGSEFIKKNKQNCQIFINCKKRELTQNLDLINCQLENEILEIKLRPFQNLTNIAFMFCDCIYLYSLPDTIIFASLCNSLAMKDNPKALPIASKSASVCGNIIVSLHLSILFSKFNLK